MAEKTTITPSEEVGVKLSRSAHTANLQRQLWNVADALRGQMDSSEYQRFMLAPIFYKFLSEQQENLILKHYSDDDAGYDTIEKILAAEDDGGEEIRQDIIDELGYYIEPEFLFSNIAAEINKGAAGKWNTDYLKTAFVKLEEASEAYDGIFDDIDLNASGLGTEIADRNLKMGEVLKEISKIDFLLDDAEIDVLGDAYEYLIANFAGSAGKKGGEFYTPQQVSKLLAEIVAYENPDMKTAYDPTCGSGSLLLQVLKETKKRNAKLHEEAKEGGGQFSERAIMLKGQELNAVTFNLAKMNMAMHGKKPSEFRIENNNTLTRDMFVGETFDAVVGNPPYSAKWNHTKELELDERFVRAGKLAPKDKADFAFVQHSWHHLAEGGTAAIVLPHGVLFRSGAEGVIRKWLIDNNALHAVIGLPENLFYGTGIATVIIILKKGRKEEDVLFIDASEGFVKEKNNNYLDDANLNKIFEAYKNRETINKFATLVELAGVEKEGYNLSIPRYVDISPDEEIIDLDELEKKMKANQGEIDTISEKIAAYLAQTVKVDKIPVTTGI